MSGYEPKRTAQEAHATEMANIKKQLEELQGIVDNFENVEKPHWGHVGDVEQANADLHNVTDRFLKRGEYSE